MACVFLQSVFSLQGPSVATTLTELFRHQFKDGKEPDYASAILGFARQLQDALGGLVGADEAHYAEKAQHAALRKRRDELTRDLTRRIVGLRRAVVGLHAEPDLSQLGSEVETAREAVPLLRQADRMVETFAKGDFETLLGSPVYDHMRFDPEGIPEQLKQDAKALRDVVAKVGSAQRRVEAALLRKQSVRSAYDRLFLRTARIFEDYCRLAGREYPSQVDDPKTVEFESDDCRPAGRCQSEDLRRIVAPDEVFVPTIPSRVKQWDALPAQRVRRFHARVLVVVAALTGKGHVRQVVRSAARAGNDVLDGKRVG